VDNFHIEQRQERKHIRTEIFIDKLHPISKLCPYGNFTQINELSADIYPYEHEAGMKSETNAITAYGKVTTAEDIGRIIRTKRKESGARQDMAAGMSEVGTKFLSQLENGKETAELGKTLRVLRKLGLNVYIYPRSADPIKG
jgi:hypothetical protein